MRMVSKELLAVAVVSAVASAGPAWAQVFPTYPSQGQTQPPPSSQPQWQGTPGQQSQQNPQNQQLQPGMPELSPWDPRSVRVPTLDDVPGQPRTSPNSLFPTWTRPEAFQGFAIFPPSLGAYGIYPPGPGGQLPSAGGQLPPPAPPAAPDWPAWIKSKRPVPLPYEPSVAVVVRQSDRVWWRPNADEPFVPLYHHDNARALESGAELEVRTTGEFLLMLYGGTRISSFGTAKLRLDELAEQSAVASVAEFSSFDIRVAKRGFACALPDGSRLVFDPPAAPEAGGVGVGEAGVRVCREIEPGRYVGRATIFNFGSRAVRWLTPLGEVALLPGYRVTMLLTPAQNALAANLTETNAAALADGPRRVWSATEDGSVTWSGARFELPTGSRLVLDPILGDPFGRRSVVAPAGAAPIR